MKELVLTHNLRSSIELALKIIYHSTNKKIIDRDIIVLTEFILSPVITEAYRFSSRNKKTIIRKLNTTYKYALTGKLLSPIIVRLIKENILVKQEDKVVYLNPKIRSIVKELIDKKSINIKLLTS